MIPLELTLKNFRCYADGKIDFNKFNVAVIVGYQSGNSNVSNAVGKTAIFDAIEYVLFNSSKSKLDGLINDNSEEMSVTFTFTQDDSNYKIVRSRTRKSSDLSLFIFHEDTWKDISGRRSSDTEESIVQLLRLDYSLFKATAYFHIKDEHSLALITPEKRKTLLKDLLKIGVYSKLEKVAKEEFSQIEKEASKISTKMDMIVNQLSGEESFILNKIETENKFNQNLKQLEKVQEELATISKRSISVKENISSLKRDNEDVIKESISANAVKAKVSSVLKSLNDQKSELVKEAKAYVTELESIQNPELPNLENLQEEINSIKIEASNLLKDIEQYNVKFKSLQAPKADTEICNLCGSKLDLDHLNKEKARINQEKEDIRKILVELDNKLVNKNNILKDKTNNYNSVKKQYLLKESNLDKKSKLESKLEIAREKFKSIKEQIALTDLQLLEANKNLSSIPSLEELKTKIGFYEKELSELSERSATVSITEKAILRNNMDYNSALAILSSKFEELEKAKVVLDDLKSEYVKLNDKLATYPYVIQAFSSTGIPSIVIASILDALQEEANLILNKIHPGLQLQFFTEKERKKDKEIEDKLLIVYYAHSKERSFEELSGAQSIAVQFALKLGLAFLFQKTSNYNFGLLLLDEIDAPLDKQSISYFTEILKSFQDNFKILTITHNDYSKEKISNQIVVEQDKTKMITTIKDN